MTAAVLHRKYIEFFLGKGHREITGKSLIPENNPSVLFTTAGMHPLVPYLTGQSHPEGSRLVNVQKCLRTQDIETVGDGSHLTFFEMLGNWSIRDYGKKEAISWSYEFLTGSSFLNLDAERLSVTIFEGDQEVPKDTVARGAWLEIGIPPERIFELGRTENWWIADQTGPCGPDTEMFYDTLAPACSSKCRPGCSCGKYLEIWNDVFMQYERHSDGSYTDLPRLCVDTGMGLERTAAMLQGKKEVYETELFQPILGAIEKLVSCSYLQDTRVMRSFRIIADHLRGATMILGDEKGISPSNLEQGYVLRKLLRRAIREAMRLGVNRECLADLVPIVLETFAPRYPELVAKEQHIRREIREEEKLFRKTLQQGEKEFTKLLPNLLKSPTKKIPGRVVFRLYDTFGLPAELTEELAHDQGLTIDKEGFQDAFVKHKKLSQKSGQQKFKGGLADHSAIVTRYHTATHLLHEALRRVLGPQVEQKGSNITTERLRFDFSHPEKMTEDELQRVETLVNEKIEEDLQVSVETCTLEEAKAMGARALFEGRYDEKVKVYSIGEFSREVCGGPHVSSLRKVGSFRIIKESSVSRGTRRVRAVLEPTSPQW